MIPGCKCIVVGSIKEIYYQKKVDAFLAQMKKRCMAQLISVPDESIPKQASELVCEKIKKVEGEKILSHIGSEDYVVALCIEGKAVSQEDIRKLYERAEQQGKKQICFVIGGSLGLSHEVIQRSDAQISFSNMTFPHQLMRVMLLEVLEKLICDM